MPGAIEPLEVALRAIPDDPGRMNWVGYDSLFRALVRLAPEKAAGFLVDSLRRDPRPPWAFTVLRIANSAPLATLVRYYRTILSRSDLPAGVRSELYEDLPWSAYHGIQYPAARRADAEPFIAFLEEQLSAEPGANTRTLIQQRLDGIRKDLAQDE